jgi:hypothetical protein
MMLFASLLSLLTARDAIAQPLENATETAPKVGYSLRAGLEVGARWFAYSDPLVIATNLRPYDVVGVPLLTFGGELRPFVWSRVPVLEKLAISFDYAFAPTLDSSTNDSEDINTMWDHGDLNVHVPVRLGKHDHAPQIGATIGYGWLGFSFATTGPLAAEIPSASYRFVRIGLTTQIPLSKRWAINAAFDYLGPLAGGAVYDRFRDSTINGIDAQFGIGVEFARGTRALLSIDYTRFFSSFVPIPGDAYVAGGALDQFGGVKIGIEYGR